MKLSKHFDKALAAFAAGVLHLPSAAFAQSPLDVVLNGRAAADTTNMTEDGIEALAISGGNILLFGAGLLGVILGAFALKTLYYAHSEGDDELARRAWAMIAISGLITVPAIVAAIVPFAMGV